MVLLHPLLMLQGAWVRLCTPRLPEATGATRGVIDGTGPPLRLLAVGESTAAGVGVATHAEGFAAALARTLAQASRRRVEWQVAGQGGLTVDAARAALLPRIVAPVDLAVLLFGVNDAIARRSARQWRDDLRALIAGLRERMGDGAAIVIAGVPPLAHFPALPGALRRALGAQGAMLDAASSALGRELPRVLHAPLEFPGGREHFARDGFHPSALGYRRWAEELLRQVPAGFLS